MPGRGLQSVSVFLWKLDVFLPKQNVLLTKHSLVCCIYILDIHKIKKLGCRLYLVFKVLRSFTIVRMFCSSFKMEVII